MNVLVFHFTGNYKVCSAVHTGDISKKTSIFRTTDRLMKRITASQSSAHRGSNVKNTVISTVCSTTQAAKTWKKVIRLSITDPLWGESTDAQWKHPTESQKCEKHSSCNFYDITEMLIAHRTADRSTFGKQVLMSSVLEMIFTIPCISFTLMVPL